MGTYSTLIKQTLALMAIGLVIAWAAPADAKLWILGTAGVACVFFTAISIHRHRQIVDLAAEVDEVLHLGRHVDFKTCSEGDVAILSNELQKMVSRLARMHDQLEEERNALADSLADVSHQIRTPMTAAALMLPAIEHADDVRERIQAVRELEAMLERVSWLVTTLLKIAKVDAGAIHFESKAVNVREVVEDALATLGIALDLHNIDLTLTMSTEAHFTGDARWTVEALQNIVKNCMEHTPPGGSITIESTDTPIATVIRVTDSGPGISEEDLPHIFERFYRGHERGEVAENVQIPTGFGIGLSLAQALISAQGGTLRASNASQGGACFEVAFPKMVV